MYHEYKRVIIPSEKISFGLDSSGCQSVFQQSTHHSFSIKNYILFGFQILKIPNNSGNSTLIPIPISYTSRCYIVTR